MGNLKTSVIIDLNSRGLTRGLKKSSAGFKRFSNGAKQELTALKHAFTGIQGKIAALGISASATVAIFKSAQLDKSLIQIKQTAGASKLQIDSLRNSLFRMGVETGQSIEALQSGFNNLIQSGLKWNQAIETIQAINPAMAVTGAKADVLASSLTVASQAFQFDLAKAGLATKLLDQMTVAGRLGNAELEDLSSIFSRIGINAKTANLSFSETLGFVEQLSLIEKNPERLATLADSTLRIFTNQNYQKKASQVTGVKFYNEKGDRRSALDVLDDIAAKYKKLKTQIDKDKAIQATFGGADLDTIKGLRTLLEGSRLSSMRGLIKDIDKAGETIKKDLSGALNNSVDQVKRLKTELRSAADNFSRPINDTLSKIIKFTLDKKKNGGLEASGSDLLLGAAGVVGGTLLAARYGGKALKALGGKFRGIASGVATGKVLQETAGVPSVYVVNMPGDLGGLPGIGNSISSSGGFSKLKASAGLLFGAKDFAAIRMMGAGALATSGALVAGAGAAGYGLGTLINDQLIDGTEIGNKIGESIAKVLAAFGNKEAKIAIEINSKGQAVLKKMKADNLELEVSAGSTMVMP